MPSPLHEDIRAALERIAVAERAQLICKRRTETVLAETAEKVVEHRQAQGLHALLQADCRSAQARLKRIEEGGRSLTEDMAARGHDIGQQFDSNSRKFDEQVAELEAECVKLADENEALGAQLARFEAAAAASAQHEAAELKAKELEERLLGAQLAEAEQALNSQLARVRVYSEHVAALRTQEGARGSRLRQLHEQMASYRETLEKSAPVLASIGERQDQLEARNAELAAKNTKLGAKLETNVALLKKRARLDTRLLEADDRRDQLAAECRALHAAAAGGGTKAPAES
jgi:chromosome segregation ATPase